MFIGLSVVLLTAYFGESGGGVLHALQRGAQEALAPLETGASRALKPARDLFGWAGDTFDAKDENERLEKEVKQLRQELARAQTNRRDVSQFRGIARLHERDGFPQGTSPIGARVIARSPTVWYSTIKIDKGSSDGVRADQPVVAPGGLVGKVSRVTGGTAEVTLITDSESSVSAQVMPDGANGIVQAKVGNPREMLLDFVEKGRRISEGATVVTSGFTSDKVESLFPRGIPVGRVTKVDLEDVELYQRVDIEPFADLRRLDVVQVLRKRPRAPTELGVVP